MQESATADHNRDFVRRLCNLEIPSDIKISPRGDKVLYSTSLTWGHLKGKVPVTKLWLATFGEAGSFNQITDGTYKDHSLAWHPVKDEFAFVSDRAGNAVKSAIYRTPLSDIGTATPITPCENEEAIERFKFSSDGRTIAFISKDEKTEEEKRREDEKEDVQVWGQGYRYSRLRVIDLETSKITTLSFDRHILDFCWIPGDVGQYKTARIAFVSCENTLLEQPYQFGTELHVVGANLEQPTTLCLLPHRANDLCWGAFTPGQQSALYFWSAAITNKNFSGSALYKVNISADICKHERVRFKNDYNVTAVQSAQGNVTIKAQYRLEDCLLYHQGDKIYSCEQEIEAYDVFFNTHDGDMKGAIATSNVNQPVEVFSFETTERTKVQLSDHGNSLQGQNFGTCTILSCHTSDHHRIEIEGIYLEPAYRSGSQSQSRPTIPYPTVVLMHGGPITRVTNAFNTLYFMWTPYLLSLGYGILLPNYRGGSGRGEEFASFSYDGVGVHDYSDVIALTHHAVTKGYADPDRLVVGGYSHGGLLANLCALRNGCHGHGWKFKAAISGASICDIDSMSLTSDMGNAYQGELHNDNVPWTMNPEDTSTRRASALWSFKETMERNQSNDCPTIPPMLVIHGANDERVHVSQAWALRRALEHYSLPFEMAIYPRQGHVFHEQNFWVDMALRVGRWVERYIGPGAEDRVLNFPIHGTKDVVK